ncbi:MAG TPA: LppP/LprE family lipoprotein [Acidimicrobiales bacterium]|nr:LppP/LprE family lipoprotein [Acidimicrobiales bacterium]
MVRSRSHNSRLALASLGALAAAVALGGGGRQSTDAADAAPAGDPHAIRDVDFAEVAQPGSACADGLRYSPPKRISVDAGESGLLDLSRQTRLEVDDSVDFGDLDGDGADEAVVHATCRYGANGAQDTVQVWTLDDGEPVLVTSVDEPPARITGPLPPSVKSVTVSRGEVAVTWTHYADDDPNCCPSEQTVLRYALDGDALDQVGRPVTRPAAS